MCNKGSEGQRICDSNLARLGDVCNSGKHLAKKFGLVRAEVDEEADDCD